MIYYYALAYKNKFDRWHLYCNLQRQPQIAPKDVWQDFIECKWSYNASYLIVPVPTYPEV